MRDPIANHIDPFPNSKETWLKTLPNSEQQIRVSLEVCLRSLLDSGHCSKLGLIRIISLKPA